VCCATGLSSLINEPGDSSCGFNSGREDDVHALGANDAVGNASQSRVSLVVVDAHVSARDEVNVVVVVALADEVVVDGLVDTRSLRRVKGHEGLGGDVALSADAVDGALDLLHLDAVVPDSDNDKVVVRLHNS